MKQKRGSEVRGGRERENERGIAFSAQRLPCPAILRHFRDQTLKPPILLCTESCSTKRPRFLPFFPFFSFFSFFAPLIPSPQFSSQPIPSSLIPIDLTPSLRQSPPQTFESFLTHPLISLIQRYLEIRF